MKLYPPVIDNKIPAFYGDSITIPFKLNKTISPNQIAGAILLIKSAENNKLITKSGQITFTSQFNDDYTQVIFSNIESSLTTKLSIGQFYKIQIAFKNQDGEIGYYSNVGIARYIIKPFIYIDNLETQFNIYSNNINYGYKGCYLPIHQDYWTTYKKVKEMFEDEDYQTEFIMNLMQKKYNDIEFTEIDDRKYSKIQRYYSDLYKILNKTFSNNFQYTHKIKTILDYFEKKDITQSILENLEKDLNNLQKNNLLLNETYKLISKTEKLSSEILYSYYFNLYDSDKKTKLDSSDIIINTAEADSDGIIANMWYTSYRLTPYKNYYIEFGGTTINGLELTPVRYKIQAPDTIDLDIDSDFLAKLDYENGCIDISLQADSKFNSMIKYNFLVSRASDKDNYMTWEPIMKDIKSFNPKTSDPNIELADTPTFHIWTDCTIEQGVSYIYALQAYNDYNIFSNPIYSNRIKIFSEETNELKNLLTQENNIFIKLTTLIQNEKYDFNLGIQVGKIIRNSFIPFANKLPIFDSNYIEEMAILSYSMQEGYIIKNHKSQLLTLYNFLEQLQTYIPSKIKDIYGKPIPVLADFEHAYLFDGERQLKLAFNPKISSFKNTILENKVDTLGGKYPFFFRNAKVKYKEFSISGLISCLMDPDNKFLTGINQFQLKTHNANGTINILDEDIGNTQLTSTNIYKERNFKIEVLEWLTNGQPKIFRSPTEGNFIVRLMNTSLSPNDTVGRMLHTFSSTAYEMADYTFDNLREYGFVDIDLTLLNQTVFICQTQIKNSSKLKFSKELKYLKCEIAAPHQGEVELQIYHKNTEITLIKFRGTYVFPTNSCNDIISLSILPKEKTINGTLQQVYEPIEIIWAYETPPPSNNFNYIQNIKLSEENVQFIGGGNVITNDGKIHQKDIIQNYLSNIEREVGQVNYLKIYRRPIEDCWYKNGKCYSQIGKLTLEDFKYADSLIYRVITDNGNYMVWRNALGQYTYVTEENFNASNPYQIILNDQIFSLEANEINPKENLNLLYTLKANAYVENPDKYCYFPITTETTIESTSINEINRLQVGLGLNVEMDYYVKTFEYHIDKYVNKPQDWNEIKNELKNAKNNLDISQNNYIENIQKYERAYNKYLLKLEEILDQLKDPEK